jgi:phage tail-like protein
VSDVADGSQARGEAAVAADDAGEIPATASARGYLRLAMPAIYRDPNGFAMRFLLALEQVLDARVAIVDSLWAYLSPQLAPAGMVDAISDWLGLALRDAPVGIPKRELLADADRLARTRGTRAGLELLLRIGFPELELSVDDHGGVIVVPNPMPAVAAADAGPAAAAAQPNPRPGFVVRSARSLSAADRAAVEWAIERQCPIEIDYRLLAGEPLLASAGPAP